MKKAGRSAYDDLDVNRFYGDLCLLNVDDMITLMQYLAENYMMLIGCT